MIHLLLFVGLVACSTGATPIESKQVQPVVSNAVNGNNGVSQGNKVRQDEDDDSEVEFNTGTPLITEIIDLGIAAGLKVLNITTPAPAAPASQPTNYIQVQPGQNPYILPGSPQAPQVVVPQRPQVIYVPVTVPAPTVETQTSGTTEAEDDDDDSDS